MAFTFELVCEHIRYIMQFSEFILIILRQGPCPASKLENYAVYFGLTLCTQ